MIKNQNELSDNKMHLNMIRAPGRLPSMFRRKELTDIRCPKLRQPLIFTGAWNFASVKTPDCSETVVVVLKFISIKCL